jgi:hypothetical protein
LAVLGLIYAVAMKGYISLLVLCMLIHLILFTPTPNEYPDIHRSIGRFLIKNLPIVNKIILCLLGHLVLSPLIPHFQTPIYQIVTITKEREDFVWIPPTFILPKDTPLLIFRN